MVSGRTNSAAVAAEYVERFAGSSLITCSGGRSAVRPGRSIRKHGIELGQIMR